MSIAIILNLKCSGVKTAKAIYWGVFWLFGFFRNSSLLGETSSSFLLAFLPLFFSFMDLNSFLSGSCRVSLSSELLDTSAADSTQELKSDRDSVKPAISLLRSASLLSLVRKLTKDQLLENWAQELYCEVICCTFQQDHWCW